MPLSSSNLFLTEFMFKWTQINLLRFFSLRLLSSSLGLVKLFFRRTFLSGVSRTWLSLSEFRFTDVCKLIFCCWRQLSFFKNIEKFSAKTFIPLWFKCNLLSLRCLLESIFSLWEINGMFHSLHISNKRLLISVTLLLRLLPLFQSVDKIFDTAFLIYIKKLNIHKYFVYSPWNSTFISSSSISSSRMG